MRERAKTAGPREGAGICGSGPSRWARASDEGAFGSAISASGRSTAPEAPTGFSIRSGWRAATSLG